MATVAAGASASETFSASANTVAITLDAGERAHVTVLSSAGALLFRTNLQNSQTIGPFATGAVMTLTAIGGSVDYTVSDGDTFFSTPAGVNADGSVVDKTGTVVSGARIVVLSADRVITAADDGTVFQCTTALTITIPAGLSTQPSFVADPPATGNLTIAVSGGAQINGGTSSLTRARSSNPAGVAVTAHNESNQYGVSGS